MIENLPIHIAIVFILTTVATFLFFYWSLKNSNSETTQKNRFKISIGLIIWLVLQTVITLQGIYSSDSNSIPPKIFLIGVLPTLIVIIYLFSSVKGKQFIDSLPIKNLTYLSIIRIPVEVVLWWLFLNNTVPELMTFEGRNFDILAGISAPLIAYFGFKKLKINKNFILGWNFICLILLLNIVINAFLSAPSALQKIAFEQPNIAILYFPFSWLPTFIVPIVLLAHLTSIRQLLKMK